MQSVGLFVALIFWLCRLSSGGPVPLNCSVIRHTGRSTCENTNLESFTFRTKVSIDDDLSDIDSVHLTSPFMYFLPRNIFNFFPNVSEIAIFTSLPQLISIDRGQFIGLKKLKRVFVVGQRLRLLKRNIFDGASAITHLFLPSNQIELIHERAFEGLNECTHLVLRNNRISSLSGDIFRHMSQLWSINLAMNRLTVLSEKTFASQKLTILDLSYNQLESIPRNIVKSFLASDDRRKILSLRQNICGDKIFTKNTKQDEKSIMMNCTNRGDASSGGDHSAVQDQQIAVEKLKKQSKKLKEDKKLLTTEVKRLKDNSKACETENMKLKDDLQVVERKNDRLESENARLKEEIALLKQTDGSASCDIKECHRIVGPAYRIQYENLKQLLSQLVSLEHRNQALQIELKELDPADACFNPSSLQKPLDSNQECDDVHVEATVLLKTIKDLQKKNTKLALTVEKLIAFAKREPEAPPTTTPFLQVLSNKTAKEVEECKSQLTSLEISIKVLQTEQQVKINETIAAGRKEAQACKNELKNLKKKLEADDKKRNKTIICPHELAEIETLHEVVQKLTALIAKKEERYKKLQKDALEIERQALQIEKEKIALGESNAEMTESAADCTTLLDIDEYKKESSETNKNVAEKDDELADLFTDLRRQFDDDGSEDLRRVASPRKVTVNVVSIQAKIRDHYQKIENGTRKIDAVLEEINELIKQPARRASSDQELNKVVLEKFEAVHDLMDTNRKLLSNGSSIRTAIANLSSGVQLRKSEVDDSFKQMNSKLEEKDNLLDSMLVKLDGAVEQMEGIRRKADNAYEELDKAKNEQHHFPKIDIDESDDVVEVKTLKKSLGEPTIEKLKKDLDVRSKKAVEIAKKYKELLLKCKRCRGWWHNFVGSLGRLFKTKAECDF